VIGIDRNGQDRTTRKNAMQAISKTLTLL